MEGVLRCPQDEVEGRMIRHIRVRFGHLLGSDAALLDTPEGLATLSRKVLARLRGSYAGVWEAFPGIGG